MVQNCYCGCDHFAIVGAKGLNTEAFPLVKRSLDKCFAKCYKILLPFTKRRFIDKAWVRSQSYLRTSLPLLSRSRSIPSRQKQVSKITSEQPVIRTLLSWLWTGFSRLWVRNSFNHFMRAVEKFVTLTITIMRYLMRNNCYCKCDRFPTVDILLYSEKISREKLSRFSPLFAKVYLAKKLRYVTRESI